MMTLRRISWVRDYGVTICYGFVFALFVIASLLGVFVHSRTEMYENTTVITHSPRNTVSFSDMIVFRDEASIDRGGSTITFTVMIQSNRIQQLPLSDIYIVDYGSLETNQFSDYLVNGRHSQVIRAGNNKVVLRTHVWPHANLKKLHLAFLITDKTRHRIDIYQLPGAS